ncbi:MAG: hypothetical protein NT145_08000 [Elusimicrobia bacterium]|nr:hypothetical protein [Elusimicrobiota bacterium]
MKKKIFFFLVLAVIFVFSKASFASFSGSISSTTITASATFIDTGTVSISLQLMNLAGGTTTQIWWNTSNINIGSTVWRRADSYIILTSTITAALGAIQIYTDNLAADASPKFVKAVSTSDPAGLVDTSSTTVALPMCWRITDTSTTTLTIAYSGGHLYSTELGSSFWCFLVMKDKGTTGTNAFTNGEDYVIVKDYAGGIQDSEGAWHPVSSPDNIYIGADFTNATLPRTYKTSKLIIEAFIE